jgi:hypothetical protein
MYLGINSRFHSYQNKDEFKIIIKSIKISMCFTLINETTINGKIDITKIENIIRS